MTAELSLPDPKEMEQAELIGKELSSLIEPKEKHEIQLVFRHGLLSCCASFHNFCLSISFLNRPLRQQMFQTNDPLGHGWPRLQGENK